MRASLFLLAYGLVLGILVLESTPRGIGDAPEYLAVATNLSRFTEPALRRTQREEYGIAFREGLTGANGRQDTIHFWMYPALAALPLRLTRALGLEAAVAFAAVNLALLLIAAALARPQLHWTSFCVLFLSPVIWWIDKIHTEIFTFSLLIIAMCAPASARLSPRPRRYARLDPPGRFRMRSVDTGTSAGTARHTSTSLVQTAAAAPGNAQAITSVR